MNILEIKNLNLEFNLREGTFQALHNVSLELKKGEFLALAGESGCGKTLTAMSILNLIPKTAKITSGNIIFKDYTGVYGTFDLLKLSQKEMRKIRGAKIALIPQDPMTSLNPLYTVGNQIIEVIRAHKELNGKDAEKAALEALDAVRIPDAKSRMKSYPHELSGGMKQRIVIASAIACESEIIIADEPTTALDVTVQAQIINLLNEIKKELKTSILFISHDLPLISENADETAIMYAGRIVEKAPGNSLFMNPKHPYTEALLNSLPERKGKSIGIFPPSIKDVFSGCPFVKACPYSFDKCHEKFPPGIIRGQSLTACFAEM